MISSLSLARESRRAFISLKIAGITYRNYALRVRLEAWFPSARLFAMRLHDDISGLSLAFTRLVATTTASVVECKKNA